MQKDGWLVDCWIHNLNVMYPNGISICFQAVFHWDLMHLWLRWPIDMQIIQHAPRTIFFLLTVINIARETEGGSEREKEREREIEKKQKKERFRLWTCQISSNYSPLGYLFPLLLSATECTILYVRDRGKYNQSYRPPSLPAQISMTRCSENIKQVERGHTHTHATVWGNWKFCKEAESYYQWCCSVPCRMIAMLFNRAAEACHRKPWRSPSLGGEHHPHTLQRRERGRERARGGS